MSQKKRKKIKKKNKISKIFLPIFLLSFLAFTLSYVFNNFKNENKPVISIKKNLTKKSEEIKEFENFEKRKFDTNNLDTEELEPSKYEEHTQDSHINKETKKYTANSQKSSKLNTKKNIEKIKKTKYNDKSIITDRDKFVYNKKNKPKLAIVIDDVTTSRQKRDILKIGYKITMAFLPPTKGHKNSAKIAQDLPFYIIHFPLQASASFKGYEENTLNINHSYKHIEKRVKNLRAWYPKATYVNNHTGSVFTQNEQAIDKLFKALKKYNFRFVDSRTTPKSVVKKYTKKYDMPYIVRNTFLDNNRNFSYIQKQLKKAVKKAKQNGYAIAIGHPYKVTLSVLKKSKHLFKGLDLIYLKELPYLK